MNLSEIPLKLTENTDDCNDCNESELVKTNGSEEQVQRCSGGAMQRPSGAGAAGQGVQWGSEEAVQGQRGSREGAAAGKQ